MAKKRKGRARSRRRKNPSGLTTGLLTVGAVVVGGISGFMLASWVCARGIKQSIDAGILEPGPNYDTAQTLASAIRG